MYLSKFVPEYLIDDSVYVPMDILESCYVAIDEGVTDPSIVDIARNNSTSMVMNILDRSYYILEKYYQSFTNYLNNFILNYAKLAEKYRTVIIEMCARTTDTIIYNTYTYPKQKDKYPKPMNINSKLFQFIEEAQNPELIELKEDDFLKVKVNNILQDFTQSYLGKKLKVEDLDNETRKHTNDTLRGVSKTIGVTSSNVGTIIDNIVENAKNTLKELKAVKAQYTKDYKMFQNVIEGHKTKRVPFITTLGIMTKPESHEFEINELRRFSNINLELNRLSVGFVTVYSSVYSTKLNIMKEHIDIDRELLVRLLQITGSFAAINNKTATKQSQPIKKVELIDKFRL